MINILNGNQNMAYQILKTDGNLLVTIPDGTISQQFSKKHIRK